MKPNFSHRQNGIEYEDRHVVLGVDQEDTTHHYDVKTSRIIAVRDGAIEHVERFGDVEDRDAVVTAWITFIEKARGWETRNYVTAHEFLDDLEAGVQTVGKLVGGSA